MALQQALPIDRSDPFYRFGWVLRANEARREAEGRGHWTVAEWQAAVKAAKAAHLTMFGQVALLERLFAEGASALEIHAATSGDAAWARVLKNDREQKAAREAARAPVAVGVEDDEDAPAWRLG
jgi:hypothetical protein